MQLQVGVPVGLAGLQAAAESRVKNKGTKLFAQQKQQILTRHLLGSDSGHS